MSDDVREAYRRGLDVREYRRMRDEGTLPTNERADLQEAYRLNIPVEELRARRAAAARPSTRVSPPQFPPSAFAEANSRDLAARPNYYVGPGEDTEEAAAMNRVQSARGRGAPRMGPGEDSPEAVAQVRRMSLTPPAAPELTDFPPNPYAETPREVRSLLSRRAAEQDRLRNRPNTRMTAAPSPADELNQQELNRIASARGVLQGGDIQPPTEQPFLDRVLGRVGLRRTNQTGMDPATEAQMRDMYGSQYSSQYNMKKGGKVKKMAKGGVVKASSAKSSASRRGDGVASRGKTKGRMV